MQQADIRKVRASVHQQCGKKVILVNDEREENPPQLLSFSYSDIITRDIRMKLC